MTRPPTIVLVDDSSDVRTLLRAQIRMSKRLEVAGEGVNGLDAAALAERHRPDIMLLDVSMPVVDGLTALPKVLAASPQTKVVMYSGFDEAGLASEAVERGAAAFVSKSASFEVLLEKLLEDVDQPAPETSEDRADRDSRFHSALADHLERFREVFEDAAIGMGTMTLAGRLVRANRSLAELLEVPAEQLVGVAFADLAEEPTAIEDALLSLDAGESAVQVEHRLHGGDDRWLRSTLSPVIDVRGRPLYIFVQVQDVTRQTAAEAELRRAEERFRLLIGAVQDYAIFMLDPTGRISSWNPGAQKIKGYSAEEIIGRHFRVFYPPELQAAKHPEHELELAKADGRYEEEGWRLRKDGSRFWANVTITAVRDESGELLGFGKVTRDSTERRQMLEQLAATNEQLEEANLQFEETNQRLQAANQQLEEVAAQQAHFFAVTAHELRTPISVLAGAADTLARHFDSVSDDDRTDLTEAVRHSSDHLSRLLDDLLIASRLQARRLHLELEELDLEPHLTASVRRIRQAASGAQVSVDAQRDLRVRADPVRLTQMVDNLVMNALRHGRPPVEVRAHPRDGSVEITVRDAGAGVAPGLQGRLFERFATASGHGTGLGLYVVRELARAHGGEAFYRADDEAFVLSLPRA